MAYQTINPYTNEVEQTFENTTYFLDQTGLSSKLYFIPSVFKIVSVN